MIIAVQRKRETRWVHVEKYNCIVSDVTRYDTREKVNFTTVYTHPKGAMIKRKNAYYVIL